MCSLEVPDVQQSLAERYDPAEVTVWLVNSEDPIDSVERFDPAVLAAVVGGTLAVVTVGCLLPARWASRVDPLEVLGAEE